MLAAFLVMVFMTGGASRIDVQSLLILRPLSIIACVIALFTLRREHVSRFKPLLIIVGAIFGLAIIHIIPLPPAFWQSLPTGPLQADVEKLAGLDGVWRPLTLTPMNGWHAMISMFVPLAVILFMIQLDRDDFYRLVPLLIGLITVSGFIGLLQVIGSPTGVLYFYRITNNGSAVGLFANRNHAATLLACIFPLLSAYISLGSPNDNAWRTRLLVGVTVGVVLIPLILVTGSRSGLLLTVIGLIGAALLFRKPEIHGRTSAAKRGFNIFSTPVFAGVGIVSLGLLTLLFSRAEAINRLFDQSAFEDSRRDFWGASLSTFWAYFPFGSGAGSFVEAYQVHEPLSLLNANYLNHAHNDWLETAVTYGVPGIAMLAGVSTVIALCSWQLWRKQDGGRTATLYGRAASLIIVMMGIASFGDYPLRTPIMMAVAAILVTWLAYGASRKPGLQVD